MKRIKDVYELLLLDQNKAYGMFEIFYPKEDNLIGRYIQSDQNPDGFTSEIPFGSFYDLILIMPMVDGIVNSKPAWNWFKDALSFKGTNQVPLNDCIVSSHFTMSDQGPGGLRLSFKKYSIFSKLLDEVEAATGSRPLTRGDV